MEVDYQPGSESPKLLKALSCSGCVSVPKRGISRSGTEVVRKLMRINGKSQSNSRDKCNSAADARIWIVRFEIPSD